MEENIFGNGAMQTVPNAQVQGYTRRQSQEVQAAVFMAKQFPRNEQQAYNRIMSSCSRLTLAESAMYEYPRGGQKVTGPSIRLAEAVAMAWGNIDFGFIELEQRQGSSSVMAYAWDLETNTRRQIVFDVAHQRDTKQGAKALESSRDIYELIANQAARRVRSCLLGIIPGDVVEAALEKCKKTIKAGNKTPLQDRIRDMVVSFEQDYAVTIPMLEEYIGCKTEAFSENDFIRLKNVYRSLRDGMAKREEIFNIHAGEKPEEERLEALNKELGVTKGCGNLKSRQKNESQATGKGIQEKEKAQNEQVRIDG